MSDEEKLAIEDLVKEDFRKTEDFLYMEPGDYVWINPNRNAREEATLPDTLLNASFKDHGKEVQGLRMKAFWRLADDDANEIDSLIPQLQAFYEQFIPGEKLEEMYQLMLADLNRSICEGSEPVIPDLTESEVKQVEEMFDEYEKASIKAIQQDEG